VPNILLIAPIHVGENIEMEKTLAGCMIAGKAMANVLRDSGAIAAYAPSYTVIDAFIGKKYQRRKNKS
jgi:hypothetical protein